MAATLAFKAKPFYPYLAQPAIVRPPETLMTCPVMNAASSEARKATTPLHAAYTDSPEEPTRAASEAMLITRPRPRCALFGATRWCKVIGPRMFVAVTDSQ